jgi:hypothetical protein
MLYILANIHSQVDPKTRVGNLWLSLFLLFMVVEFMCTMRGHNTVRNVVWVSLANGSCLGVFVILQKLASQVLAQRSLSIMIIDC